METWETWETWEIEICARCRQVTEYDRDYGGPFPQGKCPHEDCPTNSDDWYATCPAVETITVAQVAVTAQAAGRGPTPST